MRLATGALLVVLGSLFVAAGWALGGPMAEADCSHEDQSDCDALKAMGLVADVGGAGFAFTGVVVLAWVPLRRQAQRERRDWRAARGHDS